MKRNPFLSLFQGVWEWGWGFVWVFLENPVGLNSLSGFWETDPCTDYLGLTVLLTIIRNNYLYVSV